MTYLPLTPIKADWQEAQAERPQEQGVTPSGSGCQPTASAVPASQSGIPDADRKFRTARKRHRCAHASIAERGNNVTVAEICNRFIEPGQRYLEGDPDPDNAGGLGHDRFCMACAEAGLA